MEAVYYRRALEDDPVVGAAMQNVQALVVSGYQPDVLIRRLESLIGAVQVAPSAHVGSLPDDHPMLRRHPYPWQQQLPNRHQL